MHGGISVKWQREGPADCASRLGVSLEAAELFQNSDVVDLHVDSFIWHRLVGYRIDRRHGKGLFGGRYGWQVDLPRLRQVGVGGATWVITTNPLRRSTGRTHAFEHNLRRLEQTLDAFPDDVQRVANASEYRQARNAGRHAAFVGVQGGNAFEQDLAGLSALDPNRLVRVTLTHLTSSWIGQTSSPLGRAGKGLSPAGRSVVELLNEKRIFVDLAHVDRRGFFDALDVHDRSLPPIVTHTGISGAYKHWRNLDDEQVRAIADRGGTIGIMYHTPFLSGSWFRQRLSVVVDHIAHVVELVGDEHVSLGSDWDGAITTPRDMPTCLELPRLVQAMLDRGLSADSIQKVLGENFLRVLRALRG